MQVSIAILFYKYLISYLNPNHSINGRCCCSFPYTAIPNTHLAKSQQNETPQIQNQAHLPHCLWVWPSHHHDEPKNPNPLASFNLQNCRFTIAMPKIQRWERMGHLVSFSKFSIGISVISLKEIHRTFWQKPSKLRFSKSSVKNF